MNLKGAVITITRNAAGSYVDGRWVPGAPTLYENIEANIQPLNGLELLQLPEGDRNREQRKIYTAFPLQNDDLAELDGKKYQISGVKDWSAHPQPHYAARMTLTEEQN